MSNKISNVTQSMKFRMIQLASKQVAEDELMAIVDYNNLLSKVPFVSRVTKETISAELYTDKKKLKAKQAEFRGRMIKSTPEWLKKECERFGVEYPSDEVELNVRLGNVIFDLYKQSVVMPQAPLAQALFRKRFLEYAEVLDMEEFELPTEVSRDAQKILMDDKLWENCTISTWANVASEGDEEPKKVFMTMKTGGIMQYQKILSGLLAAFMPEDVKKSKG